MAKSQHCVPVDKILVKLQSWHINCPTDATNVEESVQNFARNVAVHQRIK